ncbi:DUF1542 domain-containing protein, partial [Anaerosphaera aminiphila]
MSDTESAKFEGVKNAKLIGGSGIQINLVESDNADLVNYFKGNPTNNSRRIVVERTPIGEVGVRYINQLGEVVGEQQIIPIADKDAYYPGDNIVIPDALLTNPAIPEGYHYATAEELIAMGKTQPEYAIAGEKGVEDPKITDIYVHSDKVDYTVNFVNVLTGEAVGTSAFNDYVDVTIKLSESNYTDKIPDGYHYASAEELKEGQVQTDEIKVAKDGIYTVYVIEAKEIIDARNTAKAEVQAAADKKIGEINKVVGADPEEVQAAITNVNTEKEAGFKAIDDSKTTADITTAKDAAIDKINKVALPKGEAEKLADAKAKAKAEIDQAAKDRTEEIKAMDNVSDKAIEDAVAKVEEERAAGNKAVDEATTIEDVGTVKVDAIDKINKVTPKTEAEELADAKAKAKAEIDQAAKDRTAAI